MVFWYGMVFIYIIKSYAVPCCTMYDVIFDLIWMPDSHMRLKLLLVDAGHPYDVSHAIPLLRVWQTRSAHAHNCIYIYIYIV